MREAALLEHVTCFAEDVFGSQFGLCADGSIARFDPETGTLSTVASSPDAWVSALEADAAYETGFPVLEAWEQKHGTLRVGFRLLPKQPFFLGGEYSIENLVAKPDVEAMCVRAELWAATKDLPDGATIELKASS